jgi:hypothetical protein
VNTPRTLSTIQERFLAAFFEDGGGQFYLSGGTALSAYYLAHRYSDDLDFFTREPEGLRRTDTRVEHAARAASLEIDRISRHDELVQYFLTGDTESAHPLVKCEIMSDPPPHFAQPRQFGGVRVDDLLAIAVNKVACLGRREPKDYVDLFLIVRSGQHQLEDLLPLAKQKDPGLDDLSIAADFDGVVDLPNLAEFQRSYMLVRVDLVELKDFFREWAARLFSVIGPRRGWPTEDPETRP